MSPAKVSKVSQADQVAFDRFWAAYPTRPWNPRADSLVKFLKLLKAGVDPEALIGAAGVFAESCRQRAIAPDYIPYANTWLSKRRDLDFPVAAPSALAVEIGSDSALAFLHPIAGPADFAAWIAPLRVEGPAEGRAETTIVCRTGIARDRVQRAWGRDITAQLGPVQYIVERS